LFGIVELFRLQRKMYCKSSIFENIRIIGINYIQWTA